MTPGTCRFPVGSPSADVGTCDTRPKCGRDPDGMCNTCGEGVCLEHAPKHVIGFNAFKREVA